jgi:hypothetical protein
MTRSALYDDAELMSLFGAAPAYVLSNVVADDSTTVEGCIYGAE